MNMHQRALDNNIADFASLVRASSYGRRTAATYAAETNGPDGGYAVPSDYINSIFMHEENSLLPYCSNIPTTSAETKIPTDGTAPWTASGIVASWAGEGSAAAESIPDLGEQNFTAKKLIVFVPCSEELHDDSAALAAYLPPAMRRAVGWKVNDAIINGIGAARPLGILNADATISVTKESSQAADTIVSANIAKMMSRCLDVFSARWIANPDALSQIIALSEWDGASRTLAGLPVTLTEACQALGTRGDLILANLNGYRVVTRSENMAISGHMYFDQALVAFRLVSRLDGAPIMAQPVAVPNSGNTRSHFVVLENRD